jgi:hypothetical protein
MPNTPALPPGVHHRLQVFLLPLSHAAATLGVTLAEMRASPAGDTGDEA